MFINTVDFNSIINNAEPAKIIKFIDSTITIYDQIVETYDKVSKVIIKPPLKRILVEMYKQFFQFYTKDWNQSRRLLHAGERIRNRPDWRYNEQCVNR